MENTVDVGENATEHDYRRLKEELQDVCAENEAYFRSIIAVKELRKNMLASRLFVHVLFPVGLLFKYHYGDGNRITKNAHSFKVELHQKNHEQKLALNEANFIISNLTQECEVLQVSNDTLKQERGKQELLVQELEKKIRRFENELDCNGDTDCLDDIVVKAPSATHENTDHLFHENKMLKEDIVLLKTAHTDCKAQLEKLQATKTIFEELMCDKNIEIAQFGIQLKLANESVAVLKAELQTVREDLKNAMEELSETKDDLLRSQSDLHAAKAPVMHLRGNSVFSELEDSRLKYVNKYNDLKTKYTELSKKSMRQSQETSRLMSEKVSVARLMEEMATEEEATNNTLIDALESRIRQLQEYNKQLHAELDIPIKIVSDVDSVMLKYVETLIRDTKEANWSLKKELDDRSMALLMNQQLSKAYFTELRRYKVENMKLKSELSLKKSAEQQDNLAVGTCNAEYTALNANVENRSNTLASKMDSSHAVHSNEDLVKVAKKLTFSDEVPTTKSEIQNDKDAVDVCGKEAATLSEEMENGNIDSKTEENKFKLDLSKQMSKPPAKKSYPKLKISLKK